MFIEAKNLTQAFSNTIRRKSYQIQEERQKKKKKNYRLKYPQRNYFHQVYNYNGNAMHLNYLSHDFTQVLYLLNHKAIV